ncbi:MAG: right-handed parallel beta-helix repeat-containing protein [Thermomicrobiales bacterium]|nr:right-handed parallel beta-helix repeat-containing protein [Thermomicrobiales bacterium]
MDALHFDALTRVLAASSSRRRLAGLLAAGTGGLAVGFAGEPTEAKKKRRKKKKRKTCKPEPAAQTCAGRCGSVANNCQQAVACGACVCPSGCGVCREDGSCVCAPSPCANPTPLCRGGVCTACTATSQCPAGSLCHAGGCHPCDVTCEGDGQTCGDQLRGKLGPSVLYVCPGVYQGPFELGSSKLIGAGQGTNPRADTILDGQESSRVVVVSAAATAELRHLRVTGGLADDDQGGGGGILNLGDLTVTDCTIAQNHAGVFGGGGVDTIAPGVLTMANCTISENTATGGGGGIIANGPAMLTDCEITDNAAGEGYAGGGVVLNQLGPVTLTNCTVADNTATVDGGIVVACQSTRLRLNLNGGSVTGNTAADIGNCGELSVTNGTTIGSCLDQGTGCGCPAGTAC